MVLFLGGEVIVIARKFIEPTLAALFRYLFGVEAAGDFRLIFKHVPGVDNPVADAISRGQFAIMRQLWPEANPGGQFPPLINLTNPDY